jgi:HEAT repeats
VTARLAAAGVLASAVLLGTASGAQDVEIQLEEPTTSLREGVGVQRGERLLGLGDPVARIRGVERLGSSDDEDAIDALVDHMSPGRAVEKDPRASLVAVRALARHAGAHEGARRTLVAVLNRVQAGSPETGLGRLSRATAAMALAQVGTKDTLTPLLTAVIGGGPTAELARDALLAHRPVMLGPLAKGFDDMSPRTLTLMGDLGDPRLIGVLRRQLRKGVPASQQAAAIALAKLGDATALTLATPKDVDEEDAEASAVRHEVAKAEVLVRLDTPQAAKAVASLLGRARTRSDGLRLAGASLSPALVPTLRAVVEAKVTDAERAAAVALLARIGNDEAARALASLLAMPASADAAALGLATSSGQTAAGILDEALAKADAADRRRLLRAGIVRHLQERSPMAGLVPALVEASASKDAADRAVGAFGLVALGARSLADMLASEDAGVRAAAARGALVRGDDALAAIHPALLAAANDPSGGQVGAELGLGLLVELGTGDDRIATSTLATWAEQGGLLAPLAAYRLAKRDSKPFRARLESLLVGTDPLVRLHAALGLATSPHADAAGLLVARYRFESDPLVRAAIVRALSWRKESLVAATLSVAERLDPDPSVRALARMAARGRRHPIAPLSRGREVAWITLQPNATQQRASAHGRAMLLIRGDGVALPVVAAPDGVLVVPGIAATEELRLRLAPSSP